MGTKKPSARNYFGINDFRKDAINVHPNGWLVREHKNTHIKVIGEKDNHSKVVEIWDDTTSANCEMWDTFTAQTSGTVEFWIYGLSGAADAGASVNWRVNSSAELREQVERPRNEEAQCYVLRVRPPSHVDAAV